MGTMEASAPGVRVLTFRVFELTPTGDAAIPTAELETIGRRRPAIRGRGVQLKLDRGADRAEDVGLGLKVELLRAEHESV